MSLGKQIQAIRLESEMTQVAFGELFHVTRQTVSNWENEKCYPDLQTLVEISDQFRVSLDRLLKEDRKMVRTIDQERMTARMARRQVKIIDMLSSGSVGLLVGSLMSPDSMRKNVVIGLALVIFLVSVWFRDSYNKRIIRWLEEEGEAE